MLKNANPNSSQKVTETSLLLLFLSLSAFLVSFQSARVLPLIDFTYQIEAGYRIYLGQMPYRDFLLVLPPGTYMLIAFVMKIFGLPMIFQNYSVLVLQCATILVTYRTIKSILKDNVALSLWLSVPLIFAQSVIYPFHNYDICAGFAMIFCVWFYAWIQKKELIFSMFSLGILLTLPSFFKQNTGLIFLISFLSVIFIHSFLTQKKSFPVPILGVAFSYGLFLFWLFCHDALPSFIQQVFVHANNTRPPLDSLITIGYDVISYQTFLFMYPFLLWFWKRFKKTTDADNTPFSISTAVLIAFVINPAAIAVISFLLKFDGANVGYILSKYYFKSWYLLIGLSLFIPLWYFKKLSHQNPWDPWTLISLVPALTALASFLSQGVNNSNYGIWPLFVLMMALLARSLSSLDIPQEIYYRQFKIVSVAITLLLCIYSMTLKRIKFVSLEGTVQKASHEKLRGLGTPGNWLRELEEMLDKTEKIIPRDERVATLPGEDPYYYLTEREPSTSYISYNWITCNLSSEQLVAELLRKNIKWVIIKTKLQDADGFKPMVKVMGYLKKHYEKMTQTNAYEIYHLKATSS